VKNAEKKSINRRENGGRGAKKKSKRKKQNTREAGSFKKNRR
jgi:hypothetical protein